MAVTETRARITVVDNATSGLNQIARANERMMSSLNNGGRSLAQFNTELSKLNTASAKGISNMADSFDGAAKSVSNMDKMVNRLIYSVMRYTVIYEGIKKMGDLWGTIVGGAYNYANMIETNQIGMAGILASMTKIDGKQTTWNQAMKVSAGVMKDLQSESLKTAATAQELIDTFRALLGPGLASGMTVKQIEKLTTVGTNAVKSLGLPSNQIIQELRDLVAGGIRPSSSTLATSLGITDADVKAAKQSAEGLYSFLINKMKGFEMATTQTSNTVAGKIDQIKEGLQRGIAEGMAPLRNVYSDVLGDIAKKLVVIDKTTYEWKINPAFEGSLTDISVSIMLIGEKLKDVWNTASPFVSLIGNTSKGVLGSVVNNLGLVVAGFTAFKTKDILKDLIKIATMNRFDYNAQTSIGKAIQGIRDKITGRIEKHKEEIALQEREKELIDGAVNSYAQMLHNAEQAYATVQTMNAMVNTPNSVTNLAAKWQGMGMSKAEAVARQNNIVGLVNKYGADGYDKYIKQTIEAGDKAAEAIQKQNELLKAQEAEQERIIKLYDEQMKSIDKIVSAERDRKLQVKDTANAELAAIDKVAKAVTHTATRGDKAKDNVDAYIALDTSAGPYKTKEGKYIYAWEQDAVDKLRQKLESLGYEYEVVQVTAERFMNSLHASMKGKVQPVYDQAIESAKLWNEVHKNAMQGVNMTGAQVNYKAFMGDQLISAEQKENVSSLLNSMEKEFKQVGMSAEEAHLKALDFINSVILSLKKIDPNNLYSVNRVMIETSEAAQRYADNFKLVAEHTEQVRQANVEAALEVNALKNAFKIGGEEAYQAIHKVVEESKALQRALSDRGAVEQSAAVHKELANYLTQVAEATSQDIIATKNDMRAHEEAAEAIGRGTDTGKEHGNMLERAANKTERWTNFLSELSMALSIGAHMAAENSKEDKVLAENIADAADKAFMATMAVSALVSVFKELVKAGPAIVKTLENIGKAKLFAEHPVLTGVGLVGAAVGGVTYEMYKNGHNQYNSKEGLGLDWFERQGLDFSGLSDTAKQYRAYGDGSYDNGNNSGYDFYADEASNYSKNPVSEDTSNLANRMTTVPKPDAGSPSGGGSSSKAPLTVIELTPALRDAMYYMTSGMNIYAASTLAGNEMQESGGLNGSKENIDYEADNGVGYHGSVQWGGDRFEKLKAYAQAVTGDESNWIDSEIQREFVMHELTNGDYHNTGLKLKGASSLEEANKLVFGEYEAPGDDTEGTRLAFSQQIYDKLIQLANGTAVLDNGMNPIKGKKFDEASAAAAKEKLFNDIQNATKKTLQDINDLNMSTEQVTNENKGITDVFGNIMNSANSKLKQYQKDIETDKALGISTDALSQAMDKYKSAMLEKANKAQHMDDIKTNLNNYQSDISFYQNMSQATNGETSFIESKAYLLDALERYRDYLNQVYQDTALNAQQRAEIWQKLASTQKQITETQTYDWKNQWKSALDSLKQEGINFGQLSKDIVKDAQNSVTTFFTTTGNLSKRLKATLKNLASSVLNSLAQIASSMLMHKWLGIPFSMNLGGRATGGDVLAGNSYIVGERGPELLTMGRNDGHVFSSVPEASQQKAQPITIVVNNNTGTKMKAEETTSINHGQVLKTIVLTTVEEALVTNEGGLRDAVAGLR